MKGQLIVQFPLGSEAIPDFDALVRVEDLLVQAYAQNRAATVDGHDVGLGKVNYFIVPRDSWTRVIAIAQEHLRHHGLLRSAVIAKRLASERFVVVWPVPNDGSFSLT